MTALVSFRDTGDQVPRACTRRDDLARFGGDEFVVAVPDLEIAAVERIAARLAAVLEALEWGSERRYRVGVSIDDDAFADPGAAAAAGEGEAAAAGEAAGPPTWPGSS